MARAVQSRLHMITANELMTRSPIAIDATAPLTKALRLFASFDIRHLPVVDTSGSLIGMLSDRDVRDSKPDDAVATIMSEPVLCAKTDTDLTTIIDAMIDNKIGAVPVVDAEHVLVGVVSYIDVLRAVRP